MVRLYGQTMPIRIANLPYPLGAPARSLDPSALPPLTSFGCPSGGASDAQPGAKGLRLHVDHLRREERIVTVYEANVGAARLAGWSWAAIAEQLGVTVQAVHKRFAPQVA